MTSIFKALSAVFVNLHAVLDHISYATLKDEFADDDDLSGYLQVEYTKSSSSESIHPSFFSIIGLSLSSVSSSYIGYFHSIKITSK